MAMSLDIRHSVAVITLVTGLIVAEPMSFSCHVREYNAGLAGATDRTFPDRIDPAIRKGNAAVGRGTLASRIDGTLASAAASQAVLSSAHGLVMVGVLEEACR